MRRRMGKNNSVLIAVLMILALAVTSCGSAQSAKAPEESAEAGEVQSAGEADEAGEVQSAGETEEAGEVQSAGETEEAGEVQSVGETEEADEVQMAEEAEEVQSAGEAGEVQAVKSAENSEEGVICSEDGGFYTGYAENCQAEWLHEKDMLGGIRIYTDGKGEIPFISICRIPNSEDIDLDDPEGFLYDGLLEQTAFEAQFLGLTPMDAEEVQEYSFGGKTLTGINVIMGDSEENLYDLLVLLLKEKESETGEECFIRFAAICRQDEQEEKEAVIAALEMAVRELHLESMYSEENEVQPGNLLLDFCNDEGLRVWFERAQERLPDEITYMADTWYTITDEETIRSVLEALQTVKIGGISDAHVGASDRHVFEFRYENGGENPSFLFFADTFSWGEESYEVLDWGTLKDIDLKAAASSSGGSGEEDE